MALIRLTGVHAVGAHTHAVVDDEDYARLSQFKWKAKPNANRNNVYAVRNTPAPGGKTKMLRMHRVVLGYNGPLDTDHRNHCGTDNRRDNLRIVTRSVNVKEQRTVTSEAICVGCNRRFRFEALKGSARRVCCCSIACGANPTRRVRVLGID